MTSTHKSLSKLSNNLNLLKQIYPLLSLVPKKLRFYSPKTSFWGTGPTEFLGRLVLSFFCFQKKDKLHQMVEGAPVPFFENKKRINLKYFKWSPFPNLVKLYQIWNQRSFYSPKILFWGTRKGVQKLNQFLD